jgi:hypothetical protein
VTAETDAGRVLFQPADGGAQAFAVFRCAGGRGWTEGFALAEWEIVAENEEAGGGEGVGGFDE